ncbi:hypothetical protein SH668x_000932 [Planctomicrobium sp. SH668]|uniref:hypothetical protein n=1 Tax=Planctomicrobium sp. SH668 TaxID=3448126 RepID=UPI003F5C69C3
MQRHFMKAAATLLFQIFLAIQLVYAAPPESNLLPLAVGTKWTYQSGSTQIEEVITAIEMISGERCAKLETRINGKALANEHLTARSNGIYRVAIQGEPVTPALCILKFPAQLGGKWDVSSMINGVEIAGQFTLGRAKVVVPAGEYATVTVHGTKFESNEGPIELLYYFAPGVGKVKQVITTQGKTAELALKEYSPAH